MEAKQRIGIARAVYKDGDIIFLDEATSSLDTETEKAILQCIKNLDKKYTIVIITHKENTIDLIATGLLKSNNINNLQSKLINIKTDIQQ